MAKITRKTAKVFGATATPTGIDPEIGQFGSAKAGTYIGTDDIDLIQSLPAWSKGWINAVTPTQQFPALPEMTGVHKVLSYQEAYLLQEGIAEYDAQTTYYTNSICKGLNSDNLISLYKSLIDNNIGNSLTDTTKWQEIPIEGHANKALSNLNADGNNRLHALKSYLDEGELLTDEEGLADVKSYAHSTFDLSKFSVVGSPTITDDGVLSNCSTNNIITFTLDTAIYDNFKIELEFTTGATVTGQGFLSFNDVGIAVDTLFRYKNTSNSVETKNLNLAANTTYKIIISVTGNNLVVTVNDSEFWNVDNYKTVNLRTFYLGTQRYNPDFLTSGSMDLKKLKVWSGGIPVFLGNKTGIDTIKADDYTVVGTPTITDDGVASGFSANDKINHTLSLTGTKLVATCGFNYINTGSEIVAMGLFISGTSAGRCSVISDGSIRMYVPASTNEFITVSSSDMTLTTGDFIYAVCEWNENATCKFTVTNVTTGQTVTKTGTANWNKNIEDITSIYFGSSGSNNPYASTIDLNCYKIYVDGNLVYQPCLKIPYTLSKTGSKVVDCAYRDRVQSMYAEFGYAPYYTLSDTDFTLPMGEIYGSLYDNWVYNEVLVNNTTGDDLKGASINVDLSSVLPKDNNKYLCIFRNFAQRADNGTSNNFVTYTVSNNIVLYDQIDGGTGTTDEVGDGNQFEAIIDTARTINVTLQVNNVSYPFTKHELYLVAYKAVK